MIEQLKKYFVRLVIHLPTAQSIALRLRTDGILSRSRLSSHTNLDRYGVGIPVGQAKWLTPPGKIKGDAILPKSEIIRKYPLLDYPREGNIHYFWG